MQENTLVRNWRGIQMQVRFQRPCSFYNTMEAAEIQISSQVEEIEFGIASRHPILTSENSFGSSSSN